MSKDSAFLSVRMPPELRNRLKAAAARRGLSLQELMRAAVEELLAREEKEPPRLVDVVATLRAHAPELRTRGVDHLYVFGSVARGDARVDSDIDLAIDVAPDADFSLLDLVGIKQQAEDLLGWPTDLVERKTLKRFVRSDVDREATQVF
jgi:predicted nucleotidyltransferase